MKYIHFVVQQLRFILEIFIRIVLDYFSWLFETGVNNLGLPKFAIINMSWSCRILVCFVISTALITLITQVL